MKSDARRRTLWWRGILLVVWASVIFGFSQQPGAGDAWQSSWGYILERKSAHVFEYAILLLLTFRFFWVYFKNESFSRVLLFSAIISLAYGATDELHQFFIPGRGAHFIDVCIDGLGILFMAIALTILHGAAVPRKK